MEESERTACTRACLAGDDCVDGPVCPLAFIRHELPNLDTYDKVQEDAA
jgi:hypothetical protein